MDETENDAPFVAFYNIYTVIMYFLQPVFRYIECHSGVLPSPYSQYALPRDVLDIASGEDPSKLFQLLQEVFFFIIIVTRLIHLPSFVVLRTKSITKKQ